MCVTCRIMSGKKCQGLAHALPVSASPVVYEHRSRLERSLQKERGEHKKTKEGKLAEWWSSSQPTFQLWADARVASRGLQHSVCMFLNTHQAAVS